MIDAAAVEPDEFWQQYTTFCTERWTEWGAVLHLRVLRVDGRDGISWDDLQRIKNEIVGADRLAVEVYPPEAELVNEVNMRHLWVLPEGMALPFGLYRR